MCFLNCHNLRLSEYLIYDVLQIHQSFKIFLEVRLFEFQKVLLNHADYVDLAYMMIATHLLSLMDSVGFQYHLDYFDLKYYFEPYRSINSYNCLP